MRKENIKKAIEVGVKYTKPLREGGGIRCFDARMGYGQHIDLTSEEYKVFQEVVNLTRGEQLERLENCGTDF